MKNSEDQFNKIIDSYYNEFPDEIEGTMSEEEIILSDKLSSSLNIMNILKTDTSHSDIDILAVIEKGEIIKQSKKNSLEFLCFISFSLFIILSLIIITFYYGANFFLYYELLTFILIPISIIPLVKKSQNGGN